jgi:hypothetical protein
MNAQKIIIIVFGIMATGAVLTSCTRHESRTLPSGPELSFQDVTNIVLGEWVREDHERKHYDFAVSDREEIRHLVSFMHLEAGGNDLCMYPYSITFQKRSGQPITMIFGSCSLHLMANGHEVFSYDMPDGFYGAFRGLAPKGFGVHWHPEQAPS